MSSLQDPAGLVETIRIALVDGLEHEGHELDDVSGLVHAISDRAKLYEAGLRALDALEERTCRTDIMLGTGAWVMAEQLDRAKRERDANARRLDHLVEVLGKVADDIDPKLGAIAPMNALHRARTELVSIGIES